MKLIAFFLSLIIYSAVLIFLYSILVFKKPKKQEVLIHTAIIPKQTKKISIKKQQVRKQIQKSLKKTSKLKSKSTLTKGGEDIKFDDIFKEVKYNLKTPKIKQKANLDMSRLRGVEKALNKVKNLRINISVKSNNSDKVDIDKITKKLGKVWDRVSINNGEYAIIRVVSENGIVKAFVINTNLAKDLEDELISQIESLSFNKNFDVTVKFQTRGD